MSKFWGDPIPQVIQK